MTKHLTPLAALAGLALPATASAIDVVERYDASIGENPEGVAVSPRGDVYVTLAGTGDLRRLDRQDKAGEVLASFDVGAGFLLGMAFGGDDLYVVLASFDGDTAGVWQVSEDGDTERVVAFAGTQFPNDITFDSDGNLFITESIGGAVYRVSGDALADYDGEPISPTLWVQDALLVGDVEVSPVPFPIGANGIVYDDEGGRVLVANSQNPAIIEIEDDGGEAGAVSSVVSGEFLRGADGIALDKSGDLYVVANFSSTVLQLDLSDGSATTLADADDGLVFPSTLAFGQHGPDKYSVFIANFGFGAGPDADVGLLQLEVSEKSEKNPAGT